MATTTTRLTVRRDEITDTDVTTTTLRCDDGEVLLAVERFGLTTNNVTYAVMGERMRYWRFFPVDEEGRGVVPAWGVATVVESRHGDVAVGERLYGYVPMADHVVLRPRDVTRGEVVDGSPHRSELPGAYQRYARLDRDPLHDEDLLDLELLYRPLFTTAFLLAEVLAGEAATTADDQPAAGSADGSADGRPVVVVTSASSKTGTALAHLLRGRGLVVGLTSPSNVGLVSSLGLHDRVLAYDEIDALDDVDGPATLVDLAGRADLVADVQAALPSGLATHLVVGVTHHDVAGRPAPGAGTPEPTVFFAPTHAVTLAERWGPVELVRRLAAAWRPFVEEVATRTEVVEVTGLAGAEDAWRHLVAGAVDPGQGLVVTLT